MTAVARNLLDRMTVAEFLAWPSGGVPATNWSMVFRACKIPRAMRTRRLADGSWPQEPACLGPGGMLTSIDLSLAISSIYRQTHLAAEA